MWRECGCASLVTLTGTVNLHFCVARMWLCKFSHTADLNHGVVLNNKQQFHSFLVCSFTLSGYCSQLVCSLAAAVSWSVHCLAAAVSWSVFCLVAAVSWSVLWLLQSPGLFFVWLLQSAGLFFGWLLQSVDLFFVLLLQSAGLFFRQLDTIVFSLWQINFCITTKERRFTYVSTRSASLLTFCVQFQCAVLNEKLESLLKTLNQESKASAQSEVNRTCGLFFVCLSLRVHQSI